MLEHLKQAGEDAPAVPSTLIAEYEDAANHPVSLPPQPPRRATPRKGGNLGNRDKQKMIRQPDEEL